MDHETFDRLARTLGTLGTRRAALGALFGTGLAGTLAAAEAAKKHRNKNRSKNRKSGKKGKANAQISSEAADCSSPGPSSNISGCNYQNDDFSGDNLSSSRMVATNFRGATLVGTDLSSSNAKGAIFRDANLCGADLRSSTLTNADFRNANLTNANLASSGCGGANFTGARFCNTRTCTGTIRNDGCVGSPSNACCANGDCPGAACCANACCAAGQVCDTRAPAPDTCCTPGGTCAPASCASVPDLCGGQRQCACEGGLDCCGTACINTDTDPDNCGACGNACTGCATCTNGQCSGSGACAGWQTCENGACTPTCAERCPAPCSTCVGLADNTVQCGGGAIVACDDFVCTSGGQCTNPATGNRCVLTFTSRDDNSTSPVCDDRPGGECATILACA